MKSWQKPWVIILAGAFVLVLSLGARGSIGLFLVPMTLHLGWEREPFALAAALNHLLMGASAPLMGAISDRYGTGRVIAFGCLGWGIGLTGMAYAGTPWLLVLSLGLIAGFGSGAVSTSVAVGAVTRSVPEHIRDKAAGIVAAGAAAGSVIMLPVAQGLIAWFDWQTALLVLALSMMLLLPAAVGFSGGGSSTNRDVGGPSLTGALGEAFRSRGFWLLTTGFFICGVHTGFILVHLPAQLLDRGLSAATGATALFLVAITNIAGTYAWGHWGGTGRKKFLLSGLYLGRTVVLLLFLVLPTTYPVVVALSLAFGFFFFGTLPLTSGIVGQIFGIRYLSMLFGIVFFGHQIGSFMGSWAGGIVFDATQSYSIMWMINIALGLVSVVIHLPINDRPIARISLATAEAN